MKKLDVTRNLAIAHYDSKNQIALMTLQSPSGQFENIFIECNSNDSRSFNFSDRNDPSATTTNCTENANCTVSLTSMMPGTNYTCQAMTMKTNFSNETKSFNNISTKLDSINGLNISSYDPKQNKASITIRMPDGNYDNVSIVCYDSDSQNPRFQLSINQEECRPNATCTSVASMIPGTNYTCNATTIRKNFDNVSITCTNITTMLDTVRNLTLESNDPEYQNATIIVE
ncbi:unnamed protein product, partial [Didymodactylos carnosus]